MPCRQPSRTRGPRGGITSDALSLDHARLARNLDELCCKLLVSEGERTGNVGGDAHLVVRQGGVDSEVDLQPHRLCSAQGFKAIDRGGSTWVPGAGSGKPGAEPGAFASHRVSAFTAIEILDESIAAVHGVAGGEPGRVSTEAVSSANRAAASDNQGLLQLRRGRLYHPITASALLTFWWRSNRVLWWTMSTAT